MTTISMMQVPMNDLKIQHKNIKAEIEAALAEVIEGCSFILLPQVQAFEDAYAAYCGTDH